MAGSIMVLLEVAGQYYLHTGDMRFSPKIALSTPEVFKKEAGGQFSCLFRVS